MVSFCFAVQAVLGVLHILHAGSPLRAVCHYMHTGMLSSLIRPYKSAARFKVSPRGEKNSISVEIAFPSEVLLSSLASEDSSPLSGSLPAVRCSGASSVDGQKA